VARQFFAAVEHCLGSVGSRARVYEQLGVTFVPNGSKVRLFATDLTTMSFTQLPLPQLTLKDKAIVPADFCRQMLVLAERAHTTRLAMRADHALFIADDTVLFGRVLRSDTNEIDFDWALKNSLPADHATAMIAITQQLQMALKRASLLDAATELAIEDGKATLRSRSPRGEISDTILLPGHADISVLVDAARLFDRHSKFDKILFTDRCAILAKNEHLCVVANLGGANDDNHPR
jgi:DNA polymerase III sliding clamp (beta) subunit (PCNA family)